MPSSYQAPKRGDAKPQEEAVSQSVESNLAHDTATVLRLLERKGRNMISVQADGSIAAAITLLRDENIGALVVTGAADDLRGILSERDIVRKLAETPGQTLPQKVEDIMTSDVVTCSPEEALVTVLRRMTRGRFRHMPVVDGGRLCGMLTIGDVVNFRLTEVEHEAMQLKQMIVG